jgi:hypothetical protein
MVAEGFQWGLNNRLEDLDYANDICLLSHCQTDMQYYKLNALKQVAEVAGLRVNNSNSKVMRINSVYRPLFNVSEEDLEEVHSFLYMGIVVSTGGGVEDVLARIRSFKGILRMIGCCILCGLLCETNKPRLVILLDQ